MKILTTRDLRVEAAAARLSRKAGIDADSALARVLAPPPPPGEERWIDNPRASRERLFTPESFDVLQPPGLATPSYDLVEYLATRAAQAYLAAPDIETRIKADHGTDCKYFHRWTDAAFGYRRGHVAIIAFRGTVLWKLHQWMHSNLFALPVGRPRRHAGFHLAWKRLRQQVLDWLRSHDGTQEVVLTGHSLGGAIAIMAAFELSHSYPIRAVVTFGAPRVGLTDFGRTYVSMLSEALPQNEARRLASVTRRITHADDLVSRVPPPPVFRHVGDEQRVDEEGRLHEGSSRTTFTRMLRGFDAAVGWVYEHAAASQAAIIPTVPPTVRRPPVPIGGPFAQAPVELERPSLRLIKDGLKLQSKVPIFTMLSLQALQWILMGAGAIFALGVFLLGCFDLRSHKSGLYVRAFAQRRRPVAFSPASLTWAAGVLSGKYPWSGVLPSVEPKP